MDRAVNWLRCHMGLKAWRLSATVKSRVKQAVAHVSQFEDRLAEHSRDSDCQGVICGHIHTPTIASAANCSTATRETGWRTARAGRTARRENASRPFLPTTVTPAPQDQPTAIPAQDTASLTAAAPPAASPVGPPLPAKEWQVSDTEDRPREVRVSLR